ncbi:MAG: hypothetical protein ABI591_23930 [Kofleriaceae bacterium]
MKPFSIVVGGALALSACSLLRSSPSTYPEYVHALANHDREPDTARFYTGRVPRHFDKFTDDDKRFRSYARSERRAAASLDFTSGTNGQICFLRKWKEDVSDVGAAEQQRVKDLAMAYTFAVETIEHVDAPEVKTRHTWPSVPVLLEHDILDAKAGHYPPGSGRRWPDYIEVADRLCGPLPAVTDQTELLVVTVKPGPGIELEDDPYPLWWSLTDDDGKSAL